MAFPFPQNPVNGQTVSHLAADGSLLKATYSSAKNCWNVERAIHQAPVLLSRAGVSIPTATADKQVMMWDATANQWVASTIALSTKDLADVDRTTTPADQYFLLFDAALNKYKPVPLTGGAVLTATTVGLNNQIGTGTVSAALTALFKVARPASNPKGGDAYIITPVRTNSALDKLSGTYLYDGTNWVRAANDSGGAAAHYRATSATAQEPGSKIGDLDILNELNNHQLNAYDGTNYQTVFSEQAIKQWIAAGSLFQGTLKTDPDLTALPAAGPTNRGFYWTWTGAPSHVITNPIAVTLQVGDWIQSDGTRYIHVPSDLMSKQRWSSVGSFRTWANTDYELDTLIYHNFKLYRATSAIVTGDVEPGAAGSKWQELQIKLSIEELSNVNDNASAYGQDCILVWDEANQEWTASRTLEIDAIEFDESGPATLMTGIAATSLTLTDPTANPEQWVPSVYAVKDAISSLTLESLDNTKQLAFAGDGEVVSYNATLNRWEPKASSVASLADVGDVNIATVPQKGDVLKWDSALTKWTSAPAQLEEMGDVDHHAKPTLGTMPIWSYTKGHPETGKFYFATPPAHIKNWDSVVHWESGAVVYHHGQLWRATRDSANVEPAVEDGRTQLYIHVPGEPTFGILPTDITSTPPPSGLQPMQFKLGYWLQYTNDHTVSVWKWVLKGADPATHKPIGEWEGRPWTCMVWRSPNPPSTMVPPMTVVVWIRSEPTSTVAPIKGQQDWASLELRNYLSMCSDVETGVLKDGDVLIYSTSNHKWNAAAAPVSGYTKAETDTKIAAASVKVRALSKSAYQALSSKDPTTIYLITP